MSLRYAVIVRILRSVTNNMGSIDDYKKRRENAKIRRHELKVQFTQEFYSKKSDCVESAYDWDLPQKERLERNRNETKIYKKQLIKFLESHGVSYTTLDGRTNYSRLKKGFTKETFDIALLIQNNKCAICKCEFSASKNRSVHADHDHITGRARGVLCSRCNFGLGFFIDNVNYLENAIEYLKFPTLDFI